MFWFLQMTTKATLLPFWLRNHLDNRTFSGVEWVDKENDMFKLPWYHQSRKGVASCNFDVFIQWEMHKGRAYAGVKLSRPQMLSAKVNFRCALNASKYIEAIPELDQTGRGRASYRVFRFLKNDVFNDIDAAHVLMEMYEKMTAAEGLTLLSLKP